MNVLSCKLETTYEITGVENNLPLLERLCEMGFRVGDPLEKVSTTPFGGPIVIFNGKNILAIRRSEALCIQVK